jgi:hypothetical protein
MKRLMKLASNIERIYHPYWQWEEVDSNMWGTVDDKKKYLDAAIEFTGDAELYGSWMVKVVRKWKYSCEHNLSNKTQNRQEWIGHAACALAMGCPENIIRAAWSHLSKEQQDEANAKADEAILLWEELHIRGEL